MPTIAFLIDENVSQAVADLLRERQHRIFYARDAVPLPRWDPLVAKVADELGAVVITRNHKHFKQLARYTAGGHLPSFPNAGRISLRCHEDQEVARIGALIEILEAEYEIVQRQADTRLLADITNTTLVITR